ncbi:MAG TPA: translation elongation factor Ts [Actinomycetota bacterium]
MSITAGDVKKLREATGAGMMDCKKALQDADGDFDKAKELLRERGMASAKKLSERSAEEGVVTAYLHQPDPLQPPKVGVLVEMNCATDFVAKTEGFQTLARDIALHITAMRPTVVTREELPEEMVAKERDFITNQAREEGKPENVIDKIVEGRMKTFYAEHCLLDQPYSRDESKTVGELLDEMAAEMKEPVKVRRFARFRVGAE